LGSSQLEGYTKFTVRWKLVCEGYRPLKNDRCKRACVKIWKRVWVADFGFDFASDERVNLFRMMGSARNRLGATAEKLAAEHLSRLGYTILGRNFRFRTGEIDLVAREGGCLVFVEVRSARRRTEVAPAETIGPRKQSRMLAAAAEYLTENDLWDSQCRFDVVEVVFQSGGSADIKVWKDVLEEF
jgi:putative endonuclease